MGFEVFSRKFQVSGSPAISFSKLGRLSFNKSASVKLKEYTAESVLLLWDKESKRIGVQLITKNDNRSYKIHWSPRGDGCGFTASTFLKYVGLDVSVTKSLPAQWYDEQKMFIVELPEEYLKKDEVQIKRTRLIRREKQTDLV